MSRYVSHPLLFYVTDSVLAAANKSKCERQRVDYEYTAGRKWWSRSEILSDIEGHDIDGGDPDWHEVQAKAYQALLSEVRWRVRFIHARACPRACDITCEYLPSHIVLVFH